MDIHTTADQLIRVATVRENFLENEVFSRSGISNDTHCPRSLSILQALRAQ